MKTGLLASKRSFFVLCNGRLNYYDEDWRKTFHSGYVNQKKDKFEVIPVGSRSFTIDGLTLKADNEASRDRWIRELEHAAGRRKCGHVHRRL